MNQEELVVRLRATFAAELGEQVRLMNDDLLALESRPTDPDPLKSLFRVAHTLKGAARTADVPLVEEICHSLETLLAEARDGGTLLGPDDFHLLFQAADVLADAGERLKATQPVETSALVHLSHRLRAGRSAPRAAPTHPPAPAQPSPVAIPKPEPRDDRIRVDPARLDALLASSSQLVIAGGRLADRPAEIEAVHDSAKELLAAWRKARRQLREPAAPDGIRRPAEWAEWIDARVQALTRQARRVAAASAEDTRVLQQVTGQVLDQSRRLRVRPFSEAVEALPRAARDLSAAAGKEVGLEIAGGDVEADRAVLDQLREALLQLLRNAVDHGIEPPSRREQLGKPRRGRILVTAELRGDRLAVTVADDGAGLDESSIRARLAARGRPVPSDRADLVRALLEGGTSTRAEPGPISGRGVGLDIVRAAVERIHGRLDVEWEEGRGTTFVLACPPSPASIRAMLVVAGGHLVAIPTADIATAARMPAAAVQPAAGRDTVPTAEGPVPLVPLAALLGPAFGGRPTDGKIPLVVVRSGERRLALAVDDLVAEQEIVLRPIPGREGRFPLLSGAAMLASGRVALVVDTASAVAAAGTAGGTTAGGVRVSASPEGTPTKHRVLVVEDSITTRTLEQSILEAAGYQVATAVDGVDGLAWLQGHACDLVVADVEMPRMDGLALCRAVRASSRLKRLPFVLITARESAEDRARGLEAGADAYLGKSSFDQQGLLETIRQLIG
jgi:two-component system, chemotaxis family, sensor kinase CheA